MVHDLLLAVATSIQLFSIVDLQSIFGSWEWGKDEWENLYFVLSRRPLSPNGHNERSLVAGGRIVVVTSFVRVSVILILWPGSSSGPISPL